MARAAIGHLREQGWGRIVGVTTSLDTMIRNLPYGPSKSAHESFIAIIAKQFEGSGVTANVLIPEAPPTPPSSLTTQDATAMPSSSRS